MLKNEKEKMKTKVRFTSLDITAMVSDLQSLVGMRYNSLTQSHEYI